MALFDAVKELGKSFLDKSGGDYSDPYVDDLEKVIFVIDGKEKEFVGGEFDGIQFFVESHELTTGRRLVVDNLPNADTNSIQDLGRKTRGVRFNAYLLGSDVFARKYKMIDAMESEGAKPLIHPYLGLLNARGWELTVSESSKEKRFVRMQMTFAVINESVTQKTGLSDTSTLIDSISDSRDSAKSAFEKAFDTVGKGLAVVDAAEAAVDAAVETVFEARQSIRNAALFIEKIKNIRTNIEFLLGAPGFLFDALTDLISFDVGGDDDDFNVREAQTEALSMSVFSHDTNNLVHDSSADQQSASNDQAITCLMRQTSCEKAVSTIPDIEYDSVQDAGKNIESMIDALDLAQTSALDDRVYYAALKMQTASTAYISEVSENLAQIEEIQLKHSIPVLPLAYELYSTVDGYADILRRNQIKDPFFLPFDRVLEVRTAVPQ